MTTATRPAIPADSFKTITLPAVLSGLMRNEIRRVAPQSRHIDAFEEALGSMPLTTAPDNADNLAFARAFSIAVGRLGKVQP
jgi:hypothetical protein